MNNAFGQETPPPRAASTVYFDLFDAGDVLAARPPPLVEVRPQLGVQRHTSEQIIETFVPVQVLDALVPQMGEVQVVEFMQQFDVLVVAEQVIDVPKISLDRTQQRLGDCLRQPQTADQLVEVPTIISYSTLRGLVEQNVDIPVQRGGERSLQGLRPGQGSTARTVEHTVGIPVPHSRHGVSQGQGSTAPLTQAGGPTQSQLSRPMSSGHHISMEHRLRRKQLNSDTNASNRKYLKEIQEKRKEETFSSEKMKKENEKH